MTPLANEILALAQQTFAPNVYDFLIDVPSAVRGCCCYDTSEHTDAAVTVSLSADISFDGGATWIGLGGITRLAGPNADKDGNAIPYAGFMIDAPFQEPPSKVRGTLTISGGSLVTSVSVGWQ